jgi:hypothetical protein
VFSGTGRIDLRPVYASGHCLVQSDGSVVVHVFHAGTFLLNSGMRLVFLFWYVLLFGQLRS